MACNSLETVPHTPLPAPHSPLRHSICLTRQLLRLLTSSRLARCAWGSSLFFQHSSALCLRLRQRFSSPRTLLLLRNICWQRTTALRHLSGTCIEVAAASPPVVPRVDTSACVVRLRHRRWRLRRLLFPAPRVPSACLLSHVSSTARSGADVGPASPLTCSIPAASTLSTATRALALRQRWRKRCSRVRRASRTISPLWNSLRTSSKALPACASACRALSKSAAAKRSGSLDLPFSR